MISQPGGAGNGHGPWVLLLQHGDPRFLSEAAAMTAAAVSLGLAVTLVWFGDALDALVEDFQDEEDTERAAQLFAEARQTGRVRFLACSAAMVNASAGPERVREKVDDVVGWPTTVSLILAAEKSFVW